jgi:hypothetical protein
MENVLYNSVDNHSAFALMVLRPQENQFDIRLPGQPSEISQK